MGGWGVGGEYREETHTISGRSQHLRSGLNLVYGTVRQLLDPLRHFSVRVLLSCKGRYSPQWSLMTQWAICRTRAAKSTALIMKYTRNNQMSKAKKNPLKYVHNSSVISLKNYVSLRTERQCPHLKLCVAVSWWGILVREVNLEFESVGAWYSSIICTWVQLNLGKTPIEITSG